MCVGKINRKPLHWINLRMTPFLIVITHSASLWGWYHTQPRCYYTTFMGVGCTQQRNRVKLISFDEWLYLQRNDGHCPCCLQVSFTVCTNREYATETDPGCTNLKYKRVIFRISQPQVSLTITLALMPCPNPRPNHNPKPNLKPNHYLKITSIQNSF